MSAMLNRILSLALLGLLAFAASGLPAKAQDRAAEVKGLLEQRDREIKALLGNKKTFTDQQRDQLKKVVNDAIDFEAMGKTALGPHWDKITPAQRAEFVQVFGDVVRSQSLSDLDMYRTRVSYEKVTVDGDNARAVTSVTYKDVPAKVEYAMGYRGGTWRVDDIVLDGVSTAEGYARSFQSVVRKKGFDALMTSLRKKLDKTTAGK